MSGFGFCIYLGDRPSFGSEDSKPVERLIEELALEREKADEVRQRVRKVRAEFERLEKTHAELLTEAELLRQQLAEAREDDALHLHALEERDKALEEHRRALQELRRDARSDFLGLPAREGLERLKQLLERVFASGQFSSWDYQVHDLGRLEGGGWVVVRASASYDGHQTFLVDEPCGDGLALALLLGLCGKLLERHSLGPLSDDTEALCRALIEGGCDV